MNKRKLIFILIKGAIPLLIGLFFIIDGIITQSSVMIFGIIMVALYGGIYAYNIVTAVRHYRNAQLYQGLTAAISALGNKYEAVKDFGEVGFVNFVKNGLKFSAEGKFACIKDFNGKEGYHFAFLIRGTKLVYKPEDYDDVVNYEDVLFTIELAYFDGEKLSDPENDNGIVLDNISNLKGKTVKIGQNKGYVAHIATVEWDDIDRGEITFEEWNEREHIISFKILSTYGVSDVVFGKVVLSKDND